MLAKFENVNVKISKKYSSNKTHKSFRMLEISEADKSIPPLTLFVDDARIKYLPENLSISEDTEFDEPFNVIINVNEIDFGNSREIFINFFDLEKI